MSREFSGNRSICEAINVHDCFEHYIWGPVRDTISKSATGHKIAAVVPQQKEGGKEASWQDCAVDEDLQQELVTMHGVNGGDLLGKTPVTEVVVDGIPVNT